LERARIVDAVKRLYLDRLRVGNIVVREPMSPRAEELVLGQATATVVDMVAREEPARYSSFSRKLARYERWLERLHIPEESLKGPGGTKGFARRAACGAALAVVGFPVAAYGWIHRLIPAALVEGSARLIPVAGTRKAQKSITEMLAGLPQYSFSPRRASRACRGSRRGPGPPRSDP